MSQVACPLTHCRVLRVRSGNARLPAKRCMVQFRAREQNMRNNSVTPFLPSIPYSWFLSLEKTFANCLKIDFHGESEFAVQCTTPTSAVSNCLKIDFHGENFCEFAVTQWTTPTSAVSNCLKIDFPGENFRESPQKREIRKKPAIYGIKSAWGYKPWLLRTDLENVPSLMNVNAAL